MYVPRSQLYSWLLCAVIISSARAAVCSLPKPVEGLTLTIWPKPIEVSGTRPPRPRKVVVPDGAKESWFCQLVGGTLDERGDADHLVHIEVPAGQKSAGLDTANERYSVKVRRESTEIVAATPDGVVCALATLAQIWRTDGEDGQELLVKDEPAFPWRGILLDTARHFIPVPLLLKTLDAMAASKLNIFHWHLTDASSVPLQLGSLEPAPLRDGWVYSREDIALIVARAANLSITVVPEIDMPAHTDAWNLAAPGSVVSCGGERSTQRGLKRLDRSVLDLSKDSTWNLVQDVIKAAAELFPGQYLHLGFDEVHPECWQKSKGMRELKRRNNILDWRQVLQQFLAFEIEAVAAVGKTPIFWTDLLDARIRVPTGDNDVTGFVQSWKCWKGMNPVNIGKAWGQYSPWPVVQSTCWYLDWDVDSNELMKQKLDGDMEIGGEAALWTERIDFENFLCRLWPRAAAVSGVLWVGQAEGEVKTRLNQFAATELPRALGEAPRQAEDILEAKPCSTLQDQVMQTDIPRALLHYWDNHSETIQKYRVGTASAEADASDVGVSADSETDSLVDDDDNDDDDDEVADQ
jgi:hexosaminidase